MLPFEGDALTPVAQKATAAGIPVINVDREFSTPGAFRTWIGGDNYGIGWQAGNYFADELKCQGNVVEIQGLAGISVTEDRSKGFDDALKARCKGTIKVVAQPARRLRSGEGPQRDGEHPPGAEGDRRRLHA